MILDDICAHKREEVDRAKSALPLAQLEGQVDAAPPTRDFRGALRRPGLSLIAEVKKASPALGDIGLRYAPHELATVYEQEGAAAISVLTDHEYFKGTLQDLTSVRRAVEVPVLRKEFIIDAYQIYEARHAGADAILLIVRILSDQQLQEYLALASDLAMEALVECHDAGEVERAIAADARIIGVNNRDLATFEVNIQTTLDLKRLVPGGKVLVSESGIHTRDHMKRLEGGGIDAVLVGEALVTSDDVRAKIRHLLGKDES